jgi:hypothetical protein
MQAMDFFPFVIIFRTAGRKIITKEMKYLAAAG